DLPIPARHPGSRISAPCVLSPSSSRKRDSTSTEMRRSGRHSLSRRSDGVKSTTSPIDLRRITRIRAPEGRLGRVEAGVMLGRWGRSALFCFELGLVHEHDGNVFFDGVNAQALTAFQPL